MLLRHFTFPALVVIFSLLFSAAGTAWAEAPVSKSRLGGVAIGGHDTVAYHDIERDPQANAIEGAKRFLVEYQGAKWYFASEESAATFSADPDRFKPAYNGHCANALSLGEGLVRTDGETWEIFGDELFLFYAPRGRVRWLEAGDAWADYRAQADAAWAELSR